jgi:hypothetical protein
VSDASGREKLLKSSVIGPSDLLVCQGDYLFFGVLSLYNDPSYVEYVDRPNPGS